MVFEQKEFGREQKQIINWIAAVINKIQMADLQKEQVALPETLVDQATGPQMKDQKDNLAIFIDNIIGLCRMQQAKVISSEDFSQLKQILQEQIKGLWQSQKLKNFADLFDILKEEHQQEPYEQKLYTVEQLLRQLEKLKIKASSEQKCAGYELDIQRFLKDIEIILSSENVKSALEEYNIFPEEQKSLHEQQMSSEIDIPVSHYFKQRINTKINYPSQVFSFVKPQNHQYYIMEAAKSYNDVTPFKIKHISLSLSEGPVINRNNFFSEDVDVAKAILSFCLPNTKKLAYYTIADIVKSPTVGKEYYQERELANDWNFSTETRSVITSAGKIYAINCKTTSQKIDPYLYEITDVKASNRGPQLAPKRDAALLYMNGFIYLIGGRGEGEKCSKKGYKYSIKDKKWSHICESNIALRKATICALKNRYICKLGGLNEFDYINKIIEIYDSVTDRWSLVRASPRNILEEIQILEDSLAIQINDDEIYVFGGKNSNKFNTDTGFVLIISEIKERKKGAAKVIGQLWNVSVGKRNILTFFGQFSGTSAIIQHNCIYGLRTTVCSPLC